MFRTHLLHITESAHAEAGGEYDRRARTANIPEFKESQISRPKWQSTWESTARCFSRYSGMVKSFC